MMAFFVAALLLIAVTLVFVLPPLLRRDSGVQPVEEDANLVVLRDQLRELQQDLDRGVIDAAAYEDAKRDIQLRALHDSGDRKSAVSASSRGALPWLLGAGIPIAAMALYVMLGNPLALIPAELGLQGNVHQEAQFDMEEMVEGLAKRLESRPDDVQGWDMLARSYNVMGEFDKASRAYERLVELQPRDAQLLADYADTLAMARGQSLKGEPQKLIERALAIDPNNLKALALAGTAAFEQREYREAIAVWEKILPLAAPDSEIVQTTQRSIAEAQRLADGKAAPPPTPLADKPAAPTAARLEGRVEIDPALREGLAGTDTVFVLARSREGGPPLAVIRREVRDLPFDFALDENSGVMGGQRLSDVSEVIVTARVSRSGKAERVPGEPEVSTGPIPPGSRQLRLVLR